MLSGLIYCGVCGAAMVGNRKFSGRSKLKYVTYRCNHRDRTKGCTNKEIRREYIENYVVDQLHKNLLCEEAIPELVVRLNEYIEQNEDESMNEIPVIRESSLRKSISRFRILSMLFLRVLLMHHFCPKWRTWNITKPVWKCG
ncbi:zinc ribbon domain-containing protein [Brevibacillus sp. AF8]|uniref:zinc ribbon domain-containing protein n=1 Tax=Brevibacillus sp. AF8 TaxID=2825881 RepID=UPI001F938BF5|nr:zinc ribbon domain-containing protein [Brevibacillus sp. AF8]